MYAIHLQVNHLFKPVGIDSNPVFSWQCQDGISQSAYQIIVRRDDEIIWDSGKTPSNTMNGIQYQGSKLNSRDILDFSVVLWDENDKKGKEVNSSFEMGLLNKDDWKAKWIKGNYKVNPKKRYPVDCFKKEFEIDEIYKARLYVSARGLYDCFINGTRIEDFILAPGITDYRKRIQYQAYDVTALLKKGTNTIEYRLSDGWYRGSSAVYGVTNVYGKETSLIGQLEIDNRIVCMTDNSFLWSNDGEIEFADLRDGEIVNKNNVPSYYGNAVELNDFVNLVSSNNVYVKEKEHFKAKLVKKENNKYVFDFGQNIAGYISFKIKANKNDKLEIICGETLDENNDVDLKGVQVPKPRKGWNSISLIKNLMGMPPKKDFVMTPLQKIIYTCKDGLNEYKTSFAVFGFKYIEVISDVELDENCFESIAVYSDMKQTGFFKCSNEKINKFVENALWSMKSNFLDIPTDCPTRERLGWTGDAQIFFNSGSYLMDVSSFFNKWLIDMKDGQYPNGIILSVLPYEGIEMMYKPTGTSVGWADAVYLIPYRYYKKYNDKQILIKFWPMIKKYADYLFKNVGFRDKKDAKNNPEANKYVYEKGIHLGEWLEPEQFRDKVYGAKGKYPEECTAYLSYSMKIIGEIAQILNEDEYASKCREYELGAKKVYNELFVKNNTIDTDRQAKLVRPLAFDLLEGETKKNVEVRLKKAIENYDYRVGTGFLSTVFLLPVLQNAGYTNLAYKVLESEKSPGWLYEVNQGATTIWEDWEGTLSLNHYSPGASVEWLFTSVLGINVDVDNNILLKPQPSDTLEYVEGEYKSIYGDIKAAWKKVNNDFVYEVDIPSNTITTLYLPDGDKKQLTPGKHEIKLNV